MIYITGHKENDREMLQRQEAAICTLECSGHKEAAKDFLKAWEENKKIYTRLYRESPFTTMNIKRLVTPK